MSDAAQRDAIGREIIRQACGWAGLLLGLAIILRDLIELTEFTYVLMVALVAMVIAMTAAWRQQEALSKWAGPDSGALVVIVAVLMKLVIDW
ncbi:hypothetical protein BH23CHL5_BH23CHL5_21910 [soil metagenome]